MSTNKKYFWLKLSVGFFDSLKLKKLRKLKNGDKYLIIYQKIMLISVPNEGVVKLLDIEDGLVEEISLLINEEISDVQATFEFMYKFEMIEKLDDTTYLINDVIDATGKEGDSAERVRKHRKKKTQDATDKLQCNIGVTNCNTEKELEKELNIDSESSKEEFIKPSFNEVKEYIIEKNYQVDAHIFIDYYDNTDWHTSKGKKINNWKLFISHWHQREMKNSDKTMQTREKKQTCLVGIA